MLSCVAILASCGGGSHEEEDPDDETFEHLKTEDVALGSTSGTLIELGTGKYLEKNQTYSCSFTPSTSIDTNCTVKSYDESVATVTRGTGQVFYIETHKVGDTIIYGYDVDGVLVLRRLVQVRKSYKGDETNPITLNISLDDSHKSWCEMPDDLLILFGENEGEKDTDYTYSVKDDKKSATLSLCVKDNITVCARFTDSDNAFRINPSKWEEAVNMTAPDIKYVQRVYQLGLLSGISLIRYREDYLSPNVSYHLSREVQNIGDHSLPPVYEYYVQKDGDNYKRYSRDDINDEWKITDASSSEFITPYDLRISTYLDMGSVTYETIKDSFDKERQAYFFNVVNTSGYPYSAILSFFNNKLTFFSYEYFDSTSSRTEFGFASYTYGTITPTLPE